MQDGYGRTIDYMRISITDRCNLQCGYCMPKTGCKKNLGVKEAEQKRELTVSELLMVVKAAVNLGICHFRITGGEPLMRRDCVKLIANMKKLPGVESVGLTTNGVELMKYAKELKAAGLDSVNVSLDTVDPGEFLLLTGRDELPMVLAGIREAAKCGLKVKLNAVHMERTDWGSLLRYAREMKLPLRFIEMMPIGEGKRYACCSNEDLIWKIQHHFGPMLPIEKGHTAWFFGGESMMSGHGPAKYYRFSDSVVPVGFISAMHGKFCGSCNRVRVTSKGFLQTCLGYDRGVDLFPYIEQGSIEPLERIMATTIEKKPKEHHFDRETGSRFMNQIGG